MLTFSTAAPVGHCHALQMVLGAVFILAVPSTAALFFFRVKAVYCNHRIVAFFFGFLLFALFCLSFLTLFSSKVGRIGTTRRCITLEVEHYTSAPVLLNSLMDNIIFVAISMRMISYSLAGDTFSRRVKSFIWGDGLTKLSKSILRGGQLYYLFRIILFYCLIAYTDIPFRATFGLNMVVIVMIATDVPLLFRTMFIPAHIALDSAMACRVFRSIRLGLIENSYEDMTIPTIQFASPQLHSATVFSPGGGVEPAQTRHTDPLVVEITEMIESVESVGATLHSEAEKGVHDDGFDQVGRDAALESVMQQV
jgi:hypothetical protein